MFVSQEFDVTPFFIGNPTFFLTVYEQLTSIFDNRSLNN